MKTNATPQSVIKAVENVSREQFNGNVVFMNTPKKITKYVTRFTLRTKDVNGPGSMVTKAGQKQPKANWDVQKAVMNEILRLNPVPNIYVDTIYGRQFGSGETQVVSTSDQQEVNAELEPVLQETASESTSSEPIRTKRKYTRRAPIASEERKKSTTIKGTSKLIKALKYLAKHPELLD